MHTNTNGDKTDSLPLKPSSRLRNNVIFVGGRGSCGPDGAERRTWVERKREGLLGPLEIKKDFRPRETG